MQEFNYFSYPAKLDLRIKELKERPAVYWEKLGLKKAIELAQFSAKSVPAYRDLLKSCRIDPAQFSSYRDFSSIPIIDKDGYLRKNKYESLFPNGELVDISTVSATSGSTGEPFFFPRTEDNDLQYQYVAEVFLRNQLNVHSKDTLGIIAFGLGIWIGGIYTYKNLNRLTANGLPLTLIPVGTHKDIFLKSIKKFASHYGQVILMGYPPFIKDIIDEGVRFGVNWKDYNVKILTAAESYSEEFRTYIAKNANVDNIYRDIINIYGTVELGTMAHETAAANVIRRIVWQSPELMKELFPESNRMPTLAQYHPYLHFFEEINGEVIGTGYGSAMPLVRYRFHDRGGVITFDAMLQKLKSCGIDFYAEVKRADVDKMVLKLPFVYVYERSDLTTSLVGINIYPEYLKIALQQKSIDKYVTGKFSMSTEFDRKQDQYLLVNVELQHGRKSEKKLTEKIEREILQSLMKRSTEFHHLYSSGGASYRRQLTPHIVLHAHGDVRFFSPGTKQRWVIK